MPLRHANDRLLMCNLFLEITRAVHAAYLPDRQFGTCFETLYVAVGVAIGHIDGRPFTAAKLAVFLDSPRTTVMRRLDELAEAGVVVRDGRHYCMNRVIANSPAALQCHRKVRKLVERAVELLSKLDTYNLVPGE